MSKKNKFASNGKWNDNGNGNNNGNNGNGTNSNGNGKIVLRALNDEQKQVIRSINNNTITIVTGIAGTGKAQPLDSLVYTPNGPMRMGDIEIGDKVCTPDGDISSVSGIFPQGIRDIYRIEFADGDSVECCGEHLWKIHDRNRSHIKIKGKGIYRKKEFIYSTDDMLAKINGPRGKNMFYIDTPKQCYFFKRDISIDPYVLGVILGDGCISSNQITISSADTELIENVNECLKNSSIGGYVSKKIPSQKYEYSLKRSQFQSSPNEYVEELRKYGLLGTNCYNNFIPEDYKCNSQKVRLFILQGIMDTDGYVNRKTGMPELSISSQQLANGVKEIIESLGGICRITKRFPCYTYKGEKKYGQVSYRCSIRYNKSKDLFRLSRKKELAKNRTHYPTKKAIRNIVYVGEKEAKCILIDHPDHLYITNHCIPTHNTHIAATYGLLKFLQGDYKKIILTRPCVEAYGEKLGSLPGTADDKIAPYMAPIFNIFGEYIALNKINEFIDHKQILTIPLAHQRGYTFNDAFILFDEAQNCVPKQMRLCLTRIGKNSKMVITGDVTQSDIGGKNGLVDAVERLNGVTGIGVVELTKNAIVRNPIVVEIEDRYSQAENKGNGTEKQNVQ